MGVEYRHYLVVNDPNWLPSPDTLARVDSVLRLWSLIGEVVDVRSLPTREVRQIGDFSCVDPGPGLVVCYDGVYGAAVERIAGRSLRNGIALQSESSISKTSVVIGSDIRIQWSSDDIWFEVASPPAIDGYPVNSYENEEPFDILYSQSFPTALKATNPVVLTHVQARAQKQINWMTFQGFWRGAVVIDFGKDLPSFVTKVNELVDRDFIAAISEAFRGDIVEIGELY